MARRKGVNERNRYQQRKKKVVNTIRSTAPKAITLMLAAVLTVSAAAFCWLQREKAAEYLKSSRLFKVRSIMVKGNELVQTSVILDRCDFKTSSSLSLIDPAAVAEKLSAHPWIEHARCVKKWWGSVVIEVSERKPVALINAGEIHLVDKNGIILPLDTGSVCDLPLVNGVKLRKEQNGKKYISTEAIRRINVIIKAVHSADKELFRIMPQFDVSDEKVARFLSMTPRTVVEIGYDVQFTQLKNLRYLLETLSARGESPACINIQYHNLAFVKPDAASTIAPVN